MPKRQTLFLIKSSPAFAKVKRIDMIVLSPKEIGLRRFTDHFTQREARSRSCRTSDAASGRRRAAAKEP
jgi:hypothetical protein